jgi:hypothetical protein
LRGNSQGLYLLQSILFRIKSILSATSFFVAAVLAAKMQIKIPLFAFINKKNILRLRVSRLIQQTRKKNKKSALKSSLSRVGQE